MKPRISKYMNKSEENYFKIEIESVKGSKEIAVLKSWLDELGFKNPFFEKYSENPYRDLIYKKWIGSHRFFENDDFKIHVLFSEKFASLIIKCNEKNRKKLIELVKRYFELFEKSKDKKSKTF